MSNNQLETLSAPKDVAQPADNSAVLQQAVNGGNRADFNAAALVGRDSAQKTVDNHFGGLQLVDDSAPVKSASTLAKDWDAAAKTGDFSAVNKEMATAFSHAFKDNGQAGVVALEKQVDQMTQTKDGGILVDMKDHTLTIHNAKQLTDAEAAKTPNAGYDDYTGMKYAELGKSVSFNVAPNANEAHTTEMRPSHSDSGASQRPNLTVDASGHAVETAAPRQQFEHMTARPNLVVNENGLAQVPADFAEQKGTKIAEDLKAGASDEQVAKEMQDAMRNGASLEQLVKAINEHTGNKISGPHITLKYGDDGNPDVTLKHGAFGGRQIVVHGNDVTAGATYR